jgi:gliding motility-associated-like protein
MKLERLFLFVCFMWHFIASAQIDTVFWFAAPEVSSHNSNFDIPIYLNITAINKIASVEISIPANPSIAVLKTTVAAGTSAQVDISSWINSIENTPANQVLNKGIYIKSNAYVQIYYDVASTYCNCNPELFTLKGRNALGTSFFIPSQTTVDNNSIYSPAAKFSFDIVATQDNTSVDITPTKDLVGHAAGVKYTITLNKGQTYSATALGQSAASHPAGSVVTSNKPIAVTIKDDLLSGIYFGGSCADLTGDQIVPVNVVGTNYVVVRGQLGLNIQKKDVVAITATANNTIIKLDGVYHSTIQMGQTQSIEITKSNAYIETTQPVYVLHLSGLGCELGSALLPPVKCTGSNLLGLRRSASSQADLYLNIMAPLGAEGSFKLNGVSGIVRASDFTPVTGSNQWLTATVLIGQSTVPPGGSLIVENSAGFFHLGIFEGTKQGGTAYGYISNYSQLVQPAVNKVFCQSNLKLKARSIGDSLKWFDGTKDSFKVVNLPRVYWVDYYSSCGKVSDSFIVSIKPIKSAKTSIDLCSDTVVLLGYSSNDSCVWRNGQKSNKMTARSTGVYYFTWYDKCDKHTDTFVVQKYIPFKPQTLTLECKDSLKLIKLRTMPISNWWNGLKDSIVYASEPGIYWLEYKTQCGFFRDSYSVIPWNKTVTKKRHYCENDLLCSNNRHVVPYKYQWFNGETNKFFKAGKGPIYWVDAYVNCGIERDSFELFKISLPGDTVICGKVNIEVDIQVDGVVWNKKTVGRNYTIKSPGKVIAFYSDQYCQGTSDTMEILRLKLPSKLFMPNAFSPNDDAVNDAFFPVFENVSSYRLQIYNRWGELLFSADNTHWDGYYKGEVVKEDVYVFLLEYMDCNEVYRFLNGTFTVVK